MATPLQPGLLVLHGNRLEWLAQAVLDWIGRHPLGPLEEELFLVQSNGMAEWLKMEVASALGVCSATRVELPARFLWRSYRAVLGRDAVPADAPTDKLPLTWRLMRLLPGLSSAQGYEPVAGFLRDGDPRRRLQLAGRIADLFDQYQVYRGDWLRDWAAGRDRLRAGADDTGQAMLVPPDQRWQPALWRALLDTLPEPARQATRPELHRRFLQTLQAAAAPAIGGLPRRVVLFGSTHIPYPTLEAIAAVARHSQVLMAVPNPCRYHWADIIDGRELLHAARRRHGFRADRDLSLVPLQDMHAHAHPLLAAWGRQSRDTVRQLDAFDDRQLAQQRFMPPRADLFDDGPGATLLGQVQARIRDLVPDTEAPAAAVAEHDRSIVFHVAHSPQREVEILHDQLLHLFVTPPGAQPLNPRDVVVMVPDIDAFAPAIHAVFGQHARGDARYIPWGIADQRQRGRRPLLVALEWLLRAPQPRVGFSELRDLLDVPAAASCWSLDAAGRDTLVAWIEGAGVRWGLDAAHREHIGLGACGELNTWHFGLRRMLLGYAAGNAEALAGIEPYAEVAGLSAGLAGTLAELLGVLGTWWQDAQQPRPPAEWGERLRALLRAVFNATDDAERTLLAAVDEALAAWLQACDSAGFIDPVELPVVREAWLDAVDAPADGRRFRAGGVTFCTLLPLRAIPFDAVCLLGMNDGDYPRQGARSDFDLMALAGLARPGDRSRRDDDRQLMLDALLSARRLLYVSWVGRSARDNQIQPPSVLVSQLRDHVAAVWGRAVVALRTTEHPLQPFSRAYFEGAAGSLFTYAAEWRAAHVDGGSRSAAAGGGGAPAAGGPPDRAALTFDGLARFLRNPVKAFFRERLQVRFDERDAAVEDDEPLVSAGLERWRLLDTALRGVRGAGAGAPLAQRIDAEVRRLGRAGQLPIGAPGRHAATELVRTLTPMLAHWEALQAEHGTADGRRHVQVAHGALAGLVLDDWLTGLRGGDPPVWIDLQAGGIADKTGTAPQAQKLLGAWVRCLAASASGQPVHGILIGADAVARVTAPPAGEALGVLRTLMAACQEGLCGDHPLPTAVLTGLAALADAGSARQVYEGSDGGAGRGEGDEPCLARLYPDFASLRADAGFTAATERLYAPYRDWLAAHVAVEPLPGHADDDDADGDVDG